MSTNWFSFSKLNTWLKCGEKYRRQYIEGEWGPSSPGLIRGKGLGDAVRAALEHKISHGLLPPLKQVEDVARDTVAREFMSGNEVALDDGYTLAQVRDTTVDECVAAAGLYLKRVAPGIRPVSTELKLQTALPVDGRDVIITSYTDVEEEDGTLRDVKCTGRTPEKDAADKTEQLPIYALSYRLATGRRSPRQVLDNIVMTKAPKYEPRETVSGPDDEARVVYKLRQAVLGIDAGVFPPAPDGVWWCSQKWCPFHSTCPYVRGGAVVSIPGINTISDDDVPD